MLKQFSIALLVVASLTALASTIFATPPQNDITIYLKKFWQNDMWGCKIYGSTFEVSGTECAENGWTLKQKGCALTSLTMLYWYYGFHWMPDNVTRRPRFGDGPKGILHPGRVNDWLHDHGGYFYSPEGDIGIVFRDAVQNLYYANYPYSGINEYIIPNYCCDASCKYKGYVCQRADWNTFAENLLVRDISDHRPAIMKIRWFNTREGEWRESHFVTVGGYDMRYSSYRAYDPGRLNDEIPAPGLAKLYRDGYGIKRIDRFRGVYARKVNVSSLDVIV